MEPDKSFSGASLNRKVWVAVSLVSLIPILVFLCQYYGDYITFWTIFTIPFVVFLGWAVVFKIVSAIKRLSRRSKKVLESIGERLPSSTDEVQGLERSMALLADKVKAGFEQLQQFTQKIEDLNQKVSRKVLILSTMLQANDLFSKDTSAEEVVTFLNYHLQQFLESDMCFCALRREGEAGLSLIAASGIGRAKVLSFIDHRAEELLLMQESLVFDKGHQQAQAVKAAAELQVKNIILLPVVTRRAAVGVLAAGNNKDDFSFSKDDYDVLKVFAQNVSLLWNHQELSSRVATLEMIDRLTGLYNERMLLARLDEEIKRASLYQRPCGFITLELVGYDEYQRQYGLLQAEQLLKETAAIFKAALNVVDIAGRIGSSTLAAIIIERNKRQSKKVADEINRQLIKLCAGKVQPLFSVAESPLDGLSAQELLDFTTAPKAQTNEV